ncbi:4'-phosphopantetheinyl transferase superfamily protein [Streptomyces sp. NPDC048664]|uniref:4'-phosphopantetheinyl transferase family protein n=1 Tax=Streptomyces sp. NPDC048664 TaxID=3154505 RepID=UPI0034493D5B
MSLVTVPSALSLTEPPVRPRTPSVWTADAEREGDRAARLAPAVLSEGELTRAAALRREEDRLTYLLAHVALRQLLAAATGRTPRAVRLVRDPCPCCGGPHGRPSLDDGSVHFSLSHSGPMVLLALSSTPVGADIERLPDPQTVADVVRMLHPKEIAELRALDTAEGPLAFARVWTRKEAYLKGLGTGLAGGLSRDYLGTGVYPALSPAGWSVADVAAPDGFAAAVAVRSTP